MSEWLKEHAWKADLFTRADAHRIPPTHSRSTTSRNINTRRGVPVNDGVTPGFRGACDTVLTQNRFPFRRRHTDAHRLVLDLAVRALSSLIARRRRRTAAPRSRTAHTRAPEKRGLQVFRGCSHSARTSVSWRDRSNANREIILNSTRRGCCAYRPIREPVRRCCRYFGLIDRSARV